MIQVASYDPLGHLPKCIFSYLQKKHILNSKSTEIWQFGELSLDWTTYVGTMVTHDGCVIENADNKTIRFYYRLSHWTCLNRSGWVTRLSLKIISVVSIWMEVWNLCSTGLPAPKGPMQHAI
jgi:hypothetical protein